MNTFSVPTSSPPILFDRSNSMHQKEVQRLQEAHLVTQVTDEYRAQLAELYAVEHPQETFSKNFNEKVALYIASLEARTPLVEQGAWVYFPWLNSLVHILSNEQFQKVRTARNRNLITEEEQKKFYDSRIGIAGLSVGNSVALAIALQGGARRMKLADHDTLELSNLNRIRAGITSLGLSKVEMTARQIYELNPYAELELYPEGLTEGNIDQFFADLDIFVDEMDNMAMKTLIRQRAKLNLIPVVMAVDNGEGGIVDVERYDQDPGLKTFHGRLGEVSHEKLLSLSKKITGDLIVRHIGLENLPVRVWNSFKKMGTTLVSWPQLGSAALLNGSLVAHVVQKITTGERVIDDRVIISLESLFNPTYFGDVQRAEREKILAEIQHTMQAPVIDDPLKTILTAAVQAPSGDNLQPWYIHLSEKSGVFGVDVAADHSLYNNENVAATFSLGAFVENAKIAAQSLGYVLYDTFSPQKGEAAFRIEKSGKIAEHNLFDAIYARVTNRHAYTQENLSDDEKKQIIKSTSLYEEIALRLLDSPQPVLCQAVSVNERILFENKKMHRAFFDALSWDGASPEGLPVSTLCLPLPGRFMFKLARKWDTLLKLNQYIGLSKTIPKQTAALYARSGGYGAIISKKKDTGAFYRAGCSMERAWLLATKLGLSIQPLTGILFLHHALSTGNKDLSREHSVMVQESYASLKKTFNVAQDEEILFMFRIGRSKKGGIASPRKHFSNFIR